MVLRDVIVDMSFDEGVLACGDQQNAETRQQARYCAEDPRARGTGERKEAIRRGRKISEQARAVAEELDWNGRLTLTMSDCFLVGRNSLWRAIVLRIFRLFWVAFWLLWLFRWFLWLLWLFISHPLHSQFLSFRILSIASSAAFWLCGFCFGFSHPLLSQLVFGFLHPQHRTPPATPLFD